MKSHSRLKGKGPSPALTSLFWVAALSVLSVVLFRPFFQTNDDIFKTFFIMGIGTDLFPTDFIGYSNQLLGGFLEALYRWAPGLPYYGLFMMATQAFGLWAVLYAAMLRPPKQPRLLLFIGAFILSYVHFYARPQFTMTAILAAQGSLLLGTVLWKHPGKIPRPWAWTAVVTLVFLSCLVRAEAFFLTSLCLVPFLTGSLARLPLASLPRAPLLAAGLLCVACPLYEGTWYRMDPGWRDFQQFDKERVEMQDYRIHSFNERSRPFFERAGWTENDYEMFKDWYFMDPDRYSASNIHDLKSHFPRIGSAGKPSAYRDLAEALRNPWIFSGFLLALALAFFSPPFERKILFLQMGWTLLIMVLLIYLARLPDRLACPLSVLPLSIGLLTVDFPIRGKKGFLGSLSPRHWAGTLFALFYLGTQASSFSHLHKMNSYLVFCEAGLKKEVKALAPRPDQLFVAWDSSFPFEGYDVLDRLGDFKDFRIFSLAVYQRAPNARRMLDRFGIKDLFRDMVDRPDVFLICNTPEGKMYLRYMEEKHGMTVFPERVFTGDFFRVFRIHSQPGPWPDPAGSGKVP